jgi:hypothetical protein
MGINHVVSRRRLFQEEIVGSRGIKDNEGG